MNDCVNLMGVECHKKMLELLEKIDSSYYPVFKDLFRDVEAGWYSMKLK
jgi:hypothetical protein